MKPASGGGTSFGEARFGGGADFCDVRFGGYTNFGEARFGGDASFLNGSFGGGGWFYSLYTAKGVRIQLGVCELSSKPFVFKDSDPTCLDLTEQYDLKNIHFNNASWEKNGRIKACTEDKEGRLQPTRDFYQRMKAKYKDENNEYEASKWHVAEKSAQLKLLWQELLDWGCLNQDGECSMRRRVTEIPRWIPRKLSLVFSVLMLFLYSLSSGFGERPGRAVFWFAVLIALPAFFPGDMRWYIPLMKQVMPVQKVVVEQPLPDVSVLQSFARIGWQLLISLQAALFAFALRNNFRR